ncbi:MAG: hypothetical protein VXZ72_02530 [Chlamydiota bacterium]|nr:hypothetical protein [Chlamydiota bacterium]
MEVSKQGDEVINQLSFDLSCEENPHRKLTRECFKNWCRKLPEKRWEVLQAILKEKIKINKKFSENGFRNRIPMWGPSYPSLEEPKEVGADVDFLEKIEMLNERKFATDIVQWLAELLYILYNSFGISFKQTWCFYKRGEHYFCEPETGFLLDVPFHEKIMNEMASEFIKSKKLPGLSLSLANSTEQPLYFREREKGVHLIPELSIERIRITFSVHYLFYWLIKDQMHEAYGELVMKAILDILRNPF